VEISEDSKYDFSLRENNKANKNTHKRKNATEHTNPHSNRTLTAQDAERSQEVAAHRSRRQVEGDEEAEARG